MIKPKPNIVRLKRLDNPAFDRLKYLRLDKNEDIIGFDDKTIKDMLSEVNADMISAYPAVYKMYDKISSWLKIKKESIYVSSGSDGAIKAVFEAYVSKGDEVIIIHPTYAMYYVYSDMFAAKLIKIPFKENLSLSYKDIISSVSPKTKLICIANPNSPTGTIMKHDEIISILDSANKNDTLVLLDEAYYGYYDGTYIGYINSYPNLIVTRSFTKIYGLGCARLGFAVSNAEAISNLKKVRPIYEVNSFSVLLGCYVIDHPEILKEHKALFKEGKDYLIKALKKMNIDFFNTDANFILIKMKDKKQAQTVADGLKQRKILVKAGFAEKPLCACIRVSISRVEYMKRFIDNLSDIIKSKVDTR